ncbi:MAG: hypothetical protein A3K59_05785 [Euryarchaeota archaeon RBG_19FT_COMBO_69_17]|nr:MAG: hypothetical protein A3K59_05785 [Euryarchaeota archaeon RBG_19FT_COMBO_69_17]
MNPAGTRGRTSARTSRAVYIAKLQRYVPAVFESSAGILAPPIRRPSRDRATASVGFAPSRP